MIKTLIFIPGKNDQPGEFAEYNLDGFDLNVDPEDPSTFPTHIKFKGEYYVYNQSYAAYRPIRELALTVTEAKEDDNIWFVPLPVVDRFKTVCKNASWPIQYRNRDGKQYITIEIPKNPVTHEPVMNYNQVGQFVRDHFPRASHTSGGGTNHTFRINPELT